MDPQLILNGKEYEEYYKRVAEAWKGLVLAIQNPPKHAYVRFNLLRQHGYELKHEFEISIKYPLIGDGDSLKEIKHHPSKPKKPIDYGT